MIRTGRKSKYETDVLPRFDEIASMCELGYSDQQMMDVLGIKKSAFYDYLNKYAEFADLIKRSRQKPVLQIKQALLKRATGFQYTESREIDSEKNGKTVETITKTALPDPASAMILLKHWAKDEGWTNDPQMLELKKQELEIKKEKIESEMW